MSSLEQERQDEKDRYKKDMDYTQARKNKLLKRESLRKRRAINKLVKEAFPNMKIKGTSVMDYTMGQAIEDSDENEKNFKKVTTADKKTKDYVVGKREKGKKNPEKLDESLFEEISDEDKICSICGKPIDGWGNNAWPVNDGECCDSCNSLYVIPRRMRDINKNKK